MKTNVEDAMNRSMRSTLMTMALAGMGFCADKCAPD
jgi:hypothetical protein